MQPLFEILFEDEGLLVVNKPADLVCHPTKTDEYSSLISRMRLHLGEGSHPQLVNRLDRETSGVTLAAKTPDAARHLRQQWEGRRVTKDYLAIVRGHVEPEGGLIEAPLGKDAQSKVAIKDCVRPDGAPAQTRFQVQRRFSRVIDEAEQPFTLLKVRLLTGRKHQVRIHLAHIGHPLVGDKLYGGDEDLYLALVERRLTSEQRHRLILPYQALHASSVSVEWRGAEQTFEAAPEPWFAQFASMAPANHPHPAG